MDNDLDDGGSLAHPEGGSVGSTGSPKRSAAAKVVVVKTEEEMTRIAAMVQSNFMFQVATTYRVDIPINTPCTNTLYILQSQSIIFYQDTLSTYPVDTPINIPYSYCHSLSMHPVNTNTSCQYTLSTHPFLLSINPPYQHPFLTTPYPIPYHHPVPSSSCSLLYAPTVAYSTAKESIVPSHDVTQSHRRGDDHQRRRSRRRNVLDR